MRVLSIQSSVAYGHVGNSAAVFPLQRLGHEVWPVSTVQFSNHTGYGAWRGSPLRPEEVAALIAGIEERGVLGTCDAVLSGYLGEPELGAVVADAVARVKAANPRSTYTCDPVIGNAEAGCFVRPGIPELLRDTLVPVADMVTPNVFELGHLTGTGPTTLEEVLASADLLLARGPSVVLVTSVVGRGRDTLDMVAVTEAGAWLVGTPRLPMRAHGSGDLAAALFTAHLHGTGSPAPALAATASSVYGVLRATWESGERELQLVAAQDVIAHPPRQFPVTRLR